MKTKNIFKALALAMLMPAMMLTTACSNDDDVVNNAVNTENTINKGYALPVTVNVTRVDGATRASYNESTRKLEFSTGDKLFVYGSTTAAGSFAGALDYVSEGTFSGTIYTEKEWTGTADALFTTASGENLTATLLPNGYDANGSNSFLYVDNKNTTEAYDDRLSVSFSDAFVASETAKATGVEQLSWEQASTYSSGFALSPGNAILNFTISGLAAGAQDVTLWIHHGIDYTVTGSVTPTSGVATFAIGVPVGAKISSEENNLTVGSSNFTLPSSTTFAAGKIYNIARNAIPGALIGQFSVSSTKKVYFSKGNLQATYDGSSWTWAFAENQWDYIGNAEGNTKVSASYPFVSGYSGSSTTVDLFGWVGTSSKWTDVAQYGITSSTATNDTNGYGNNASEDLNDWGNTISDGHTWFTLTGAEWQWMLGPSSSPTPGTNCRTSSTIGGVTNARWVTAVVHSTNGLIIYPDALTWNEATMGTAPTTSNATKDFTLNTFTDAQWSALEAAGCVFLPAAGYRHESWSVTNAGSYGNYWSSSPNTSDVAGAYDMHFDSRDNSLNPTSLNFRYRGFSVRLVRQVE